MTPRAFRVVAIAEALSWLALIVATIVKYSADAPLGVHILGPLHGVLFLAYLGLAFETRRVVGWDARTTWVVLAESIVPGGGYLAARRPELRLSAAGRPAR